MSVSVLKKKIISTSSLNNCEAGEERYLKLNSNPVVPFHNLIIRHTELLESAIKSLNFQFPYIKPQSCAMDLMYLIIRIYGIRPSNSALLYAGFPSEQLHISDDELYEMALMAKI